MLLYKRIEDCREGPARAKTFRASFFPRNRGRHQSRGRENNACANEEDRKNILTRKPETVGLKLIYTIVTERLSRLIAYRGQSGGPRTKTEHECDCVYSILVYIIK